MLGCSYRSPRWGCPGGMGVLHIYALQLKIFLRKFADADQGRGDI